MTVATSHRTGVSSPPSRRRFPTTTDVLGATLIFAASVAYLALLPHNLNPADESVYLYEAKRILEGQVPYRDFFEIITPGWMVLMACLFRLFGTSLQTARLAAAALHGVTGALVYLTCRRLRIRPALSWLPAVAYLVVCPWAWPIASQHWLGTTLSVFLLWVCAGYAAAPLCPTIPAAEPIRHSRESGNPRITPQPPRLDARFRGQDGCGVPVDRIIGESPASGARNSNGAGRLFAAGVVVGLLFGVHQQRGVILGAGVFTWLVLDRLRRRRYPDESSASLSSQLVLLMAGAAFVAVPLCIAMIASAGFENVWRALVVHPLVNYRSTVHCAWGHIEALTAAQGSYTFPTMLAYLPAILLPSLARLAALAARRRHPDEARRLVLLVVFCLFSMLSISYYPDFIHIAFIAPVFFVAAGENLEWAARRLPARSRLSHVAGWAAAAVLLGACGVRLERNLLRARAAFPYARATAFGRVDFASDIEAQLYDRVNELMDEVPSRQLFCYPIMSYLYLMADADNPTRYQFLLDGYNSPDQMEEVVETLRAKRLPYLVLFPSVLHPDDPILSYARRRYRPMTALGRVGQALFRRADGSAAGPSGAEKPVE